MRARRLGRPAVVAALVMGLAMVPGGTRGTLAATGASSGLAVIPASTQHWRGENDVLLEILDPDGLSLAEASVPVRLTFTSPRGRTTEATPVIERFATYGRRLYRVRLALDELGTWGVRAEARLGDARSSGDAALEVSPDRGTPPLGALAPGGDTPTLRDAMSHLHAISSDPEPLSAFYLWSLDEALANHQPVAFVIDSYAYRPNAACGGALGILHEVFIDYPGLTVIHAEPWRTVAREGMLTLDPAGGPPVLTPWARAWGVEEPPWVFVVDTSGRLHAKFSGVTGSDELRAALASVTPWRPAV